MRKTQPITARNKAPPLVAFPNVGLRNNAHPGIDVVKLLPFVLGMIAGATDVIGFLGLGLFTAHITGNIVVLAAHAVTGDRMRLAPMLAVPVFMVVVGLTRLLATRLEASGRATLRPLLLVHFLLLAGFLAACVARPRLDPESAVGLVAGMLGVAAMAVQNALVHICLKGTPSTAVMTTNVTWLVMDLVEILADRNNAAEARDRAKRTARAVVGFIVGCALGAWCQAAFGLWSIALPAGLALLALGLAAGAGRVVSRPA